MRIEVGAGGQWRLSGQLEGRKTPQVVAVNMARMDGYDQADYMADGLERRAEGKEKGELKGDA